MRRLHKQIYTTKNLLLYVEDIISIVCTSKAHALFKRKQELINKMQLLHALLLTVVVLSIFIHDVAASSDLSSTDEFPTMDLRSLAAKRFMQLKRGNNLCGMSYYGCRKNGKGRKKSWMPPLRNMRDHEDRTFAQRR